MTLRYECNPPKMAGPEIGGALTRMFGRLREISEWCGAIHVTENVLGFGRIPPAVVGRLLKEVMPEMYMTASLRVRDKTAGEVDRLAYGCLEAGFSGLLVLMGDPMRDGGPDTGQTPSAAVRRLGEAGLGDKMDLYLSIPNEPAEWQVRRKVGAEPAGFFTQVIQSTQQVQALSDRLPGFRLVPVVMYPSEKNQRSAEFLSLDVGAYADRFGEFVTDLYGITGDLLVTSPSDFAGLCSFLAGLGLPPAAADP